MRIKKGESVTLEGAGSRFLMVVDCMTDPVTVEKDGKTLIRLSLTEREEVVAEIVFADGKRTCLLGENAKGREIILTQSTAYVVLYINGVLADEEFFFSPVDYAGATLTAGSFSHFEAGYLYHSMWESAVVENAAPSLSAFSPLGRDSRIKRLLPVLVGEDLHLLYFVENKKEAGCGKGATRLFALRPSKTEGVDTLPIALPIDTVDEKGVLDAALLWHHGRGYLYYLMETSEGVQLSCAVSEDGLSYIKTGLDVEIPTLSPSSVTAIAVSGGQTPCLYFRQEGEWLRAESDDLLHFKTPVPLSAVTAFGAERLFAVAEEGRILLFAQKDGALYAYDGMEKFSLVCDKEAVPIFLQKDLCLFACEEGKLSSFVL